jgi:hypothetical protein
VDVGVVLGEGTPLVCWWIFHEGITQRRGRSLARRRSLGKETEEMHTRIILRLEAMSTMYLRSHTPFAIALLDLRGRGSRKAGSPADQQEEIVQFGSKARQRTYLNSILILSSLPRGHSFGSMVTLFSVMASSISPIPQSPRQTPRKFASALGAVSPPIANCVAGRGVSGEEERVMCVAAKHGLKHFVIRSNTLSLYMKFCRAVRRLPE